MAFIALLAVTVCFTAGAEAAGLEPSVNTADYIGDIVYNINGTVSYDSGHGILTIINPTLTSPLSAVNVTLLNGSTIFLGRIDPSSNDTIDYAINHSDIKIPLKLKETIIPSSMYSGAQQQVRLCVEIENTGDGNITGFKYQKVLPQGLSKAWTAYDGGILYVNDTVSWTLDDLGSGEKKHLAVAFNLTPSSNVYFPEAYIRFTYCSSVTGKVPGFSGSTNTSFQIQKSNPGVGIWYVDAIVPDNSEFTIGLNSVFLYRSDAADPFAMSQIASYAPNQTLNPGCDWKTSLIDHFNGIPAYFMKLSYSIPYTLEQVTYLANPAKTEPYTMVVSVPMPTATLPPQSYNPYVPPWPSATPSPSPPPLVNPDILFVTPIAGSVITNNTTELETSVPPSSDPGYVVYYGSADNKTWVKLGESPIEGNVSELMWAVPQMNGKYYLKAEHYNSWGLVGMAFTQVLIAHEILPVDVTTMLISGTDWLMLLLALIALLLLLFIIMPYSMGKPVVYDSSALYALSKDKGWLSRLPRRTIRPDEVIFEIEGVDRIKMKALRNVEEMRRLEREYSLQTYDAMAMQLAKETGAVLYTADARIVDISKKLGIDAKPLDKLAVAIKR